VPGGFSALGILVAALSDVSFAIIVGASFAGPWLEATLREVGSPRAPETNPALCLFRLRLACTAVLLTCHLLRPWLIAAGMSGSTGFAALAFVPDVLSSTRQGNIWYSNSLALAGLLATQLVPRLARPIATWITVVSLCILAMTKAASSHAADDGDFTFVEISQFLHLLATAVWSGAILVAGFVIVPVWSKFPNLKVLWNFGHRLSRTVTWALPVLLLSGIYTSGNELGGRFGPLWTTPWGKILLTKGAFVCVALVLGSLSRFTCLRFPVNGGRAARFAGLVRAEAIVMAVILCISGLLANTSRVTP
jgi:putative copper resistance protein D